VEIEGQYGRVHVTIPAWKIYDIVKCLSSGVEVSIPYTDDHTKNVEAANEIRREIIVKAQRQLEEYIEGINPEELV
jgi:hypothetical protein